MQHNVHTGCRVHPQFRRPHSYSVRKCKIYSTQRHCNWTVTSTGNCVARRSYFLQCTFCCYFCLLTNASNQCTEILLPSTIMHLHRSYDPMSNWRCVKRCIYQVIHYCQCSEWGNLLGPRTVASCYCADLLVVFSSFFLIFPVAETPGVHSLAAGCTDFETCAPDPVCACFFPTFK